MALMLVAVALATAACQRSIFRQYEYEEEIYLKLDGSATVYVNTSIAALIALRGFDADTNPATRVDRDQVRAFYTAPGVHVTRVSAPWRRLGRRFVQIRVDVDDIRQLSRVRPFDWSTYQFSLNDGHGAYPQTWAYRQTWGPPAGRPVPNANWDGTELVAVRMHLPSRIEYHNTTAKTISRGNIAAWEQPLRDRLRGEPLTMEVRMQTQSILYRTLTIFGLAFAAALLLMGLVVLWIKRKGRADALSGPASGTAG